MRWPSRCPYVGCFRFNKRLKKMSLRPATEPSLSLSLFCVCSRYKPLCFVALFCLLKRFSSLCFVFYGLVSPTLPYNFKQPIGVQVHNQLLFGKNAEFFLFFKKFAGIINEDNHIPLTKKQLLMSTKFHAFSFFFFFSPNVLLANQLSKSRRLSRLIEILGVVWR